VADLVARTEAEARLALKGINGAEAELISKVSFDRRRFTTVVNWWQRLTEDSCR